MKKIIHTEQAPEAIGPYSQCIRHKGTLYLSGQIPLDAKTGSVAGPGIRSQTRLVLENIGKILHAAGSDFEHVLKCTVYLADMADFPAFNEVYETFFRENPPARETVAVRSLPKEVGVEISCIAFEPE